MVALPHGDAPFANFMEYKQTINYDYAQDKYESQNIYDYIVIPNNWLEFRYGKLNYDKLKVLGSARYCEEWMEIAEQLFLSQASVKRSISLILKKLDAHNRSEAVSEAYKRGML